VKEQPLVHQGLVLNIEVIDPSPVEGTAAAYDAVDFIPFVEKQFRQV